MPATSGAPTRGSLANRGGQTDTLVPRPGSPAIDGAAGPCPPTDQRGAPRPQGAGCDRGAVEATPQADLALGLSDRGAKPRQGARFTYRIPVKNQGPDVARAAALRLQLAKKLRVVSAKPTAGTCTRGKRSVRCALGDLAPGARVTIRVVALAQRAGTRTASAGVSTPTLDPLAANGRATEKTEVRRRA